jgi:Arc/MetJ-type ribon-helix-helix transcriptional regulator
MHRLQIQLTNEQEHALRDLAQTRRSSISALVRESIELLLCASIRTKQRRNALEIIGAYASKQTDVSIRHDAYLAQAYGHADDSP